MTNVRPLSEPSIPLSRPEKSLYQAFRVLWPLWVLTGVTLIARLGTLPKTIESRDGLFFTRALTAYSVEHLRPHWPGYPVYIWLGKAFALFLPTSADALHVLSAVASALTILPIAGIAAQWRRTGGGRPADVCVTGFAAGAVWAFMPMAWVEGSEILSDPLALLVGTTMLWVCMRALQVENRPMLWLVAAGVLGGLLLGVRLAYFPLLLAVVYVTWRRRNVRVRRIGRATPLLVGVSVGATCAVWLGWQFAQEGAGYIRAAQADLHGHYTEWGNSILTDPDIWTRPVRFLEKLTVLGFGGWWPDTPLVRLLVTLTFLGLVAMGLWRCMHTGDRPMRLLVMFWLLPYVCLTVVNYDLDQARYTAPVVILLCILAGIGVPKPLRIGVPVLVGAVGLLALVSVPLAQEHATELPVATQLTRYLNATIAPQNTIVLVSDDAPYLIFFTQNDTPGIPSLREVGPALVQEAARRSAQGQVVYIVGAPGHREAGLQPIAHFSRGQFMESFGPPDIVLYRFTSGTASAPAV